MSYGRVAMLLAAIMGLNSCKLGVRSSTPKTEVEDASGRLLAHAAVTTLSFRAKEALPAWEVEARVRCGDKPYPSLSRLDDLVYELIPEYTRQQNGTINRGDSSLCRYQGNTAESIRLTRNLFADKALAIKVKYLAGYENRPPPMIRFNSGGAVHVSQENFASLFVGQCSEFAMMNGMRFCKTIDRFDGKVIWVALVAPMAGGHALPPGGGLGAVGKGEIIKGEVVVEQHGKGVEQVGQIDAIKGVEQVEFGKGGKGMPFAAGGGRIDMDITLPWLQGSFNIAVEVPHFNTELIGRIQGSGGYSPPSHPPGMPPTTFDYGAKLDRDEITVLVPRPLRDPRGSSGEGNMLRLTLKTRPKKPHAGRWVGFGKAVAGLAGGVVAIIGGVATAPIVLGVFATAAAVSGVVDLSKWKSSYDDKGYYDDFMVPSDVKNCPAIYNTNLTFNNDDRYLTFKSERRQAFVFEFWDNLGVIQHTPIGHIGVNAWSQVTLQGFTVFYCRRSFEKHCDRLPDKMFSEELKANLKNCANTDDGILAKFGHN